MPKKSVYEREREKEERAAQAFLRKMKKMGHSPQTCTKIPMSDWVECSCGWKSRQYYDGFEYAWNDWKKHAQQQTQAGQAELQLDHRRK